MKKNMGAIDRILRTIIAIILGVLFFTGTISGVLGTILLIIGAIFLVTSIFGFCPLYALFGWKTQNKNPV